MATIAALITPCIWPIKVLWDLYFLFVLTVLSEFIQVCHIVFCTGKTVGGCHLLHNGTGLNMGFVVGPPFAVSDSTLVIRYKSGDVCNLHSTLKHYRSTTIMFHCSLKQVSYAC